MINAFKTMYAVTGNWFSKVTMSIQGSIHFLNINMRMLDASFSTELARKQQDEKGGGVGRNDRKEGMKKEKEKEKKRRRRSFDKHLRKMLLNICFSMTQQFKTTMKISKGSDSETVCWMQLSL